MKKGGSISSLFKRVDFQDIYNDVSDILLRYLIKINELESYKQTTVTELSSEEQKYFSCLYDYSLALLKTIKALQKKQYDMLEASRSFIKSTITWKKFKENEKTYKDAINEYAALGKKLNSLNYIINEKSKTDYVEIQDVLRKWNKISTEEVYWELKAVGVGEDIAKIIISDKDLLDKYFYLRNQLRQKCVSNKNALLKIAIHMQDLIAKR